MLAKWIHERVASWKKHSAVTDWIFGWICLQSFHSPWDLQINISMALCYLYATWVSLVAQTENNLPVMQCRRPWVWTLGWEDPLEKGMATHSSILAWTTPWPEEPDGLRSVGSQRIRHDWATNTYYFYSAFIDNCPKSSRLKNKGSM